MARRTPPTELYSYVNADGHTVHVLSPHRQWLPTQTVGKPSRRKRTTRVYDPHISARPITQDPARLI